MWLAGYPIPNISSYTLDAIAKHFQAKLFMISGLTIFMEFSDYLFANACNNKLANKS